MKLIVDERALSKAGLKFYFRFNGNEYLDDTRYKIVISSVNDCGFKWFNLRIYKYDKKR